VYYISEIQNQLDHTTSDIRNAQLSGHDFIVMKFALRIEISRNETPRVRQLRRSFVSMATGGQCYYITRW